VGDNRSSQKPVLDPGPLLADGDLPSVMRLRDQVGPRRATKNTGYLGRVPEVVDVGVDGDGDGDEAVIEQGATSFESCR